MLFIDENRRFPWVVSNDEKLLENPNKREKRKTYIQKYLYLQNEINIRRN